MKTKITLLGLAIATVFSSCSKETFVMSSDTGGYGAYHKTEKVAAAKTEAATEEVVFTAAAETTPAEIAQVPSFTATKAAAAKVEARTAEVASTEAVAPVAITKKELKAAVKAAKKDVKKEKDTKDITTKQIIAALLAFFVGYLGIHRFYLGYTGKGILQLAMFLVGIVLSVIIIGIPILLALWIWVLIDLIRILTGGLQPKNGSY